MRKPFWSLVMIVCSALSALCMLAWTPSDPPLEARIVSVSRQDVHQVAAITGRLIYADESIAFAPSSGVVERISVKPGQRVGEGEALLRLHAGQQEDVLAAFIENASTFENLSVVPSYHGQTPIRETVLRAESPCTVREVLICENAPVAAGTPVLRLTSNEQEIRCSVAKADLKRIETGLWAWISTEAEPIGFARVEAIGDLEADALTGMTCASVTLKPDQHIDLPEGAAVDAEIYLSGSDDVLALPLEAITPRDTVWWVSDGRCTEISAEIVMTDEIHAWVSLPEGMQVAVGEFKEGQRIVEAPQ